MKNNLIAYARRVCVVLGMGAWVLVSACSDDDPPLPDNEVGFQAGTAGIAESDLETTVTLNLTRPVTEAVVVTIALETKGLTYGVEFTTEPAATDNGTRITLNLAAGDAAMGFKVVKKPGLFFQGTESISFSVADAGGDLVVSAQSGKMELKFSAIVSEGGTLQLNGLIANEAGSAAGNTVFVDLSNNEQTPVDRKKWNLGFYNGDDFRVIINNTAGASVIALDKTDLAAVTSADVNVADFAIGGGKGTFNLYDNWSGKLDGTAIPQIGAAAGKVYVINTVGGSGQSADVANLFKVRFSRKGTDGYTVQYAAIDDTKISSADVIKNAANNFNYFSFTAGSVAVEPPKTRWDIQWGWSIYHAVDPESAEDVPYGYSDMVFINHLAGTQAAEILITDKITYDSFSAADVASVTWSSDRNIIGSNWRATTGTIGVKKDRFYVIKDATGNIYKLSFISFHAQDGGTRGKPQFKYALVKKA